MGRKIGEWKRWARNLKKDLYVLYLAYKHPDTPWYAKAFTLTVVAYALSPIDFIPDFIPILGYLDDVILLPLGIVAAIKMLPDEVLEECRETAENRADSRMRKNWIAGIGFVLIWCLLALWLLSLWI
ncbi:MAG TPA: YkvA family protein [Bacillales bacterium]|nr:YkvA family protein [Bacillales bacterium]